VRHKCAPYGLQSDGELFGRVRDFTHLIVGGYVGGACKHTPYRDCPLLGPPRGGRRVYRWLGAERCAVKAHPTGR
jgi:hypothetical protein